MGQNINLPVVMWQSTRLKGTYDVGYLCPDESEPYIMRWGNTKDKETSEILAKNILNEIGERHIVRYEKEIILVPIDGLKSNKILAIETAVCDDILFGKDTVVLNEYPHKRTE